MAFKGCNLGNWPFTVTAVVIVVSALATVISFSTITAITVTATAFAWLTLLFAALVCAWRGTLIGALGLGLLTGRIQGLRCIAHRCAHHVTTAAFGAVIAPLSTAAIAVTTTLTAAVLALATLAALTLWCV